MLLTSMIKRTYLTPVSFPSTRNEQRPFAEFILEIQQPYLKLLNCYQWLRAEYKAQIQ